MSSSLSSMRSHGPSSPRATLGRLLLAIGLMLGLVGALFPSTASAIVDPNLPNDGWNDTWNPNVDWSTHPDEWPHPAPNPTLTQRCGIDIGIVIDRSGSIAQAPSKETIYKDAAKALVDSLAGTPSKVGVWSFANEASDTDAATYPWLQMADMNVPANVTALKNKIDSIPILLNYSTNYEEGIRAPFYAGSPVLASPRPDLIIVITDGQPTVHADDAASGGTTNNDDIAGGILSANLVKATGTRVFAAGVGGATAEGLRLISGTNEFNPGGDIATSDYLITSWEQLDDELRAFATELCGASVTVTKQTSSMAAPGTFSPAAGWTFTGTLADGPAVTAANGGVTGPDGTTSFTWSSPETEAITITETQQAGYELVDLECELDGQTVGQENGLSVTIPVDQGDQVSCVYKNRPVFIDLSVTKDDGKTVTTPGDTLTYEIDYANAADATATATNVVLSETVPANTTWVDDGAGGWDCTGTAAGSTCTYALGSLAPGASGSVDFVVTVDDPVPSGVSQITNTVTITGTGTERDLGDQTDTDTDTLDANPLLQVVKTDGDAGAVEPGDVITYSIDYDNLGNEGASGVYLSETVPAHTTYVATGSSAWSCADGAPAGSTCTLDIGSLAGGAGGSATFKVQVVDPVPAGVTSIANLVLIDDDVCQVKCDDDPEDTPVDADPDLTITKGDGGVTAVPGGTITYAITYANDGDEGATGVYLSETVPDHTTFVAAGSPGWDCNGAAAGVGDGAAAGATCTFTVGNLAGGGAGGSAPFQVRVVDPVPAGVTEISNAVLIDDDVCQESCDTDDEDTPVDAAPELEVEKTDNGATVEPGDELTYTIRYRNVGNQTATGVTLTDVLPAHTSFVDDGPGGWTCLEVLGVVTCTRSVGDLPVSDTFSEVSITVVVDDPLSEKVDTLTNNVAIDDDECEVLCDEDDEDTPVDASPVLTVDKDDDGATGTAGGVVVYDIDYANNGNEPATGVVLTETVPQHTTFVAASSAAGWDCNGAEAGNGDGAAGGTSCRLEVGTLVAGASGSTTFGVRIVDPVPAGVEEVVNAVTIGDDEAPNPDDADTEPTPVDAASELSIVKGDGDASVSPGGTITYTIEYANGGDQDATGVVLTETVPDLTTFVAAGSSAGWTCDPDGSAGSECTLAVGDLAGGAEGTATFVVQVDASVPAGVEVIDNTVTISDDDCEGVCDEDDEDTPLDAAPDLTVTKDDGGVVADLGDEVTYSIAYANVGDQDATGVVITETVPAGSTFVGSESDWSCSAGDPAGTVCEHVVGDLAAGGDGSVDFTVQVDAELPEGQTELDNLVVISDDGENGEDPTPENNEDTDDTPVRIPEVLPNVITPPTTERPTQVAGVQLPRTGGGMTQPLLLMAGALLMLGGVALTLGAFTPRRRKA